MLSWQWLIPPYSGVRPPESPGLLLHLSALLSLFSGYVAASDSTTPAIFAPAMVCPLLDRDRVAEVCAAPAGDRRRGRHAHLAFCDAFTLSAVNCFDRGGQAACRKCARRALKVDKRARAMYAVFDDLLTKVNCRTEYSRRWTCHHCKVGPTISIDTLDNI